jgi:hypothetical protein
VVELLFPKLDDQEYSIQAERQVKIMIPHWGVFYPRGRATMHTGDPALRQAMNELFAKVQAAIEAAHLAGVERGKQLLIQLSKGELTMKQFNENAVEENQNTNYG